MEPPIGSVGEGKRKSRFLQEGKRKSSKEELQHSIGSVGSSDFCKEEPILAKKKPRHIYFLRSMSRPCSPWNDADSKKLLTALKTSWAAEYISNWKYIASTVDKPQYVCREAFEKKMDMISLFGKLIRENDVQYDFKNNKSLSVPTDFWNDTTREKYSIFLGVNGIPDFQDWKLLLRVARDEQSFAPRPSKRSTASGVSEDVSSDDVLQRAFLAIKDLYRELKQVETQRRAMNQPPLPDNERLTMENLFDLIDVFKDPVDAKRFLTCIQDDRDLLMGWLHRKIADYNESRQAGLHYVD